MIAALFVERGGTYYGLPGVDPWDQKRDARRYSGPWPVVAHPPCARWGRYWFGGPTYAKNHNGKRLRLGDDDGCFESALHSVRQYGGVLEHPEGSHAWRWFELNLPPHSGAWVNADFAGGWTCCVEQGWYGHRARKKTWLYACHIDPTTMNWGRAPGVFRKIDLEFHNTEERRRAVKTGIVQLLSARQRAATPTPFRDALIDLARTARCSNDAEHHWTLS